ncbi:MAG: SurA N-terminal domain-containing protein [Nitrospirae bacterium]|nr:SurA N-terminal domain-containing protein [Nitrospirota bacterium]
MKKIFVLFLLLVLGFVFSGCTKKEGATGKYLAKINNVKITKEDVDNELAALPVFARNMFAGENGTLRLLDEIVKKELLYQEAKKKGLDKDPLFKKRVADSQKLILISALLEKEIEAKANVTEIDMKQFYEKHKAEFTVKGKPVDFEQVKSMIAQRLTAQKQKEVFDSYVENLKKSYKIDINKEAISELSKKEETKEPAKAEQTEPKK